MFGRSQWTEKYNDISRVYTKPAINSRETKSSDTAEIVRNADVGANSLSPNLSPVYNLRPLDSPKHYLYITYLRLMLHLVCRPCFKKNCAKLFLSELCQIPPILIIFGRKMAKRLKLCELHSLPTSSNLRHYTTMLNADVPNCYIMLKLLVLDS